MFYPGTLNKIPPSWRAELWNNCCLLWLSSDYRCRDGDIICTVPLSAHFGYFWLYPAYRPDPSGSSNRLQTTPDPQDAILQVHLSVSRQLGRKDLAMLGERGCTICDTQFIFWLIETNILNWTKRFLLKLTSWFYSPSTEAFNRSILLSMTEQVPKVNSAPYHVALDLPLKCNACGSSPRGMGNSDKQLPHPSWKTLWLMHGGLPSSLEASLLAIWTSDTVMCIFTEACR